MEGTGNAGCSAPRFGISRALAVLLAFLSLTAAEVATSQDLPPIRLKYSSYALSREGAVIGYFGEERRVQLRSLGEVAPVVIDALLATEDRDFFEHDGVSLKGLGRAVWRTLTGNTQGGSTLTMQLARNLFLSHERSISRKLAEINLARELESAFSKKEILLLYLNTVYFGGGNYGIWTAAHEYFSEDPKKLDVVEAATLVGLLQGPELYNPLKHPDRALKRRNEVLHNLVEVGKLSKSRYAELRNRSIGLRPRHAMAPHFTEQVRREASRLLQGRGARLTDGGFRIRTTLDTTLQAAAETAVLAQWKDLPEKMRSAQVGLVTLDVRTGDIVAMVGGNPQSAGRDLNHAVQIKRQPGSSFKPFLYASLLEQGYTLATPIRDTPIVIDSGTAWEWRPMNDSDSASGKPLPMKAGIQHSLNLIAAHAMVELTEPSSVAGFAHRVGITSELDEYPSLALGTEEVSPLEMATGFATFASSGVRTTPRAVRTVETQQGDVLFSIPMDTVRVLDSATAYLITDALEAVVDSGTATSVRRYYNGPAAGKTGTTQRSTDAWFVGYTPRYSTAVWMGFDDAQRKLSGTLRYGGTACAPVWGRMMAKAGSPDSAFVKPSSIEYLPLCRESGLLGTAACPAVELYPVNVMLLPMECDQHGGGWFW